MVKPMEGDMSLAYVDETSHAESTSKKHCESYITVYDYVDEIAKILLANIDKNLTMDDLSAKVGWCNRSIAYAFTKRFGLPPKQWLLHQRVQYARKILLSSNEKVCLQELSARLGFPSPSKFGMYYRRLYGETPRETVRRRRSGVKDAA